MPNAADHPPVRRLSHGGWDPENDPPPREAVERSLEWIQETLRARGQILIVTETNGG